MRYRGRPQVRQALNLLAPFVDVQVISANRNLSRYRRWADAVTSDFGAPYAGPLEGIRAALALIRSRWLLVCPCDATGVPADVPGRLLRAVRLGGHAAVVQDPQRLQPLLLAIRADIAPRLDAYLAAGGRSVHGFLELVDAVPVRIANPIGNRNVMASVLPPPG